MINHKDFSSCEQFDQTIHFVTEELNGGSIALQAKVPIFDDDTEQEVIERVLTQEHQIYPLVVK